MTLSEIKQKIDEYFATHTEQEVYDALVRNGAIAEESPESETIVGYVARDANGVIGLYQSCPRRLLIDKVWDSDYGVFEIPQDSFPFVTWESEPLKVKLPIIPIEDE